MDMDLKRENRDKLKRLAHVGKLSAGIGHNIMTPLSLIMMHSDLLSMKVKNHEELAKHVSEISHQASLISGFVENLMWKVNTESQESPSLIQVGKLIESNVQFWMGDMFFKHKLQKEIQINTQTPPLKGIPYHFTAFMDEWIVSTIERARPLGGGNSRIEVDCPDAKTFYILFEDTLPPPTEEELKELKNGIDGISTPNVYFPAYHRLLLNHPAQVGLSVEKLNKTSLRLTWCLQ